MRGALTAALCAGSCAASPLYAGTTSPALKISSSSVSFGNVEVNTAATPQVLTLTSSGTAALKISSATVTGAGAFTTSGVTFPVTLNPGQSVKLSVHCAPISTGAKTATLTLTSNNATGGTSAIALSATAVIRQLNLSAASLSFGGQLLNTAAAKYVTLRSSGTASLTVHSAQVTGAPAFTVSGVAFPLTLAPGQTAQLKVTFDPTSSGSKDATLTVSSNTASGKAATIPLSGAGVVAALTLSTRSIDFGSLATGTSARKTTVTLSSTGTAALTIRSGKVTGSTAFAVSGVTFPVTLNPGQKAALTVTFDPTPTGTKAGTINLTSNATADGTATVSLSGKAVAAPAFTLSTASMNFGTVAVSTPATRKTLTVTSKGADALTITGAKISGSAAFTVSGPGWPVTLKQGQTATLSVGFDPGASGAKSGTLALATNAITGNPSTVALSGSGVAPLLTLSASKVAFGNDPLNTAATARKVTVKSTGTVPLTLDKITLMGSPAFSVSAGKLPMTLSPGEATTLTIGFDPGAAGEKSATVDLTSNASAEATSIALSGTGIAPGVLSGLSCGSGSMTGAGSDSCKITMTAAAGSGGATIVLSSSDKAVTVPASVAVPAGATSATFSASVSAVTTTQTATLKATGAGVTRTYPIVLNAAKPALTLSATTVAFGNDPLNTAATARKVTVKSTGTLPLILDKISLAGAAAFSMSAGKLPMTLNPGSATTLTIGFDPISAGAKSATLQLASNASPATIDLSGTGVAPGVLSGLSCSSGSMTGAGSDSCKLTMTAAAGSGGATITLSSSDQAVTVPASVTIPAGSSSGTFSASVSAVTTAQTATLKATSSGVTETYPIVLNAATPALTLGSATLSFGDVAVNTTATQDETLTSSGTAPVTISADSVAGSGFSLGGLSLPVTLNPGQQAMLEIQFDPTAAGSSSGTVSLKTNTSSGTATIGLSGTGTTASYQVDLSWDAPSSSNPPVVGYYVFRAVSGSSNYQQLNGTADASTTYQDTSVEASTTYVYYVESVDEAGNTSAPSGTFSVTVP